eukprot:790615-Pelagomonas_calceolata.AAC.2
MRASSSSKSLTAFLTHLCLPPALPPPGHTHLPRAGSCLRPRTNKLDIIFLPPVPPSVSFPPALPLPGHAHLLRAGLCTCPQAKFLGISLHTPVPSSCLASAWARACAKSRLKRSSSSS